jgi:hypothetical protein
MKMRSVSAGSITTLLTGFAFERPVEMLVQFMPASGVRQTWLMPNSVGHSPNNRPLTAT